MNRIPTPAEFDAALTADRESFSKMLYDIATGKIKSPYEAPNWEPTTVNQRQYHQQQMAMLVENLINERKNN